MEKKGSKQKHGVLTVIQDNLDKAITDLEKLEKISDDDLHYYKAVRNIIDYKLKEAYVKANFKSIESVMLSIAKMDFTQRIKLENSKDLFDYIGSMINMVAEELETVAIPKSFIEPIMNSLMVHKADLALLVDVYGLIKFVSIGAEKFGFRRNELLGRKIQEIIAVDIQFMVSSSVNIKDLEIHLIDGDVSLFPAIVTVEEIPYSKSDDSHYLYLIKSKTE